MNASENSTTPEVSSTLAKVRSLREQADKLTAEAKFEALVAAAKAVSALNELGFEYRLVEGHPAGATGSRGKGVTRPKRDLPCPICQFRTEPPHDGRLHRAQSTKKLFTAAELKERHLSKIE